MFEFREEVAPVDGETVVRKTTFSPFNSTAIDGVLRRLGVRTLVLAEVTTHCCVETTGRDASERGYGVVLVDEATADFDDRAREVARTFPFNFGPVLPTVSSLLRCLDAGST